MKVYYSGTHASGKSTLARYTSGTFELPLLTEVARTVLSERELNIEALRSDINVVNSYQTEVFYRQIEEENRIGENFVADRCLLDCLAYSIRHSTISTKLIADPKFQNYLDKIRKDSIIFFIKPSKNTLKNDGVREPLTWTEIIAIDSIIQTLFEIYNIQYFQINTDSMRERVRLVDQVLKRQF